MCHCTKQGVDLLFANGRVDHIAELEELLLGQPALLPVINQSEGIPNGSQCSLMQLQIPPEQNLQAQMCFKAGCQQTVLLKAELAPEAQHMQMC